MEALERRHQEITGATSLNCRQDPWRFRGSQYKCNQSRSQTTFPEIQINHPLTEMY